MGMSPAGGVSVMMADLCENGGFEFADPGDAFYESLLQRYAEGVVEFDMDRVEILPYRGDAKKRTTVVRTQVRLDDGSKIPVDYTLVNRDDRWRMFDVKIEGVSYVINFRKELESEIRATSLEAVIQRLERDAGLITEDAELVTEDGSSGDLAVDADFTDE